jgi:predicted nuclease of restriction endonuclease-like RecB superfamily
MLTGALVRVRHVRGNRVVPVYVRPDDPALLELAERLLLVFRAAEGLSRGELQEELSGTFGDQPGQFVLQGLTKLLEDRCEFEVVAGHPPEDLRSLVFRAAAEQRRHPAGERPAAFDRAGVLRDAADQLGLTAEAVEAGLFADLKTEQRLVRFQDLSPERLLHRYNVALAQSVLLRAVGVGVVVRNEPPARLRQLLRAVKFHRLVCEVGGSARTGYRLQLDGPLSLFTATQKYGLQLGLFLPALLHCADFELTADLLWGPEKRPKVFTLSSADGLVSHRPEQGTYVPPELAMFAEQFRKKVADWRIAEETAVLPLGDGFWVPDYRLEHVASGRVVYLEVLGFWRRASAERHLRRLREHARQPFVLAVSEQLRIDDEEFDALPAGVHRFKQLPLAEEVARLAAAQL